MFDYFLVVGKLLGIGVIIFILTVTITFIGVYLIGRRNEKKQDF